MSEEPARSSMESSSGASSGPDFVLRLRPPGSDPDPDRKSAASTSDPAARDRSRSPRGPDAAPPPPSHLYARARDSCGLVGELGIGSGSISA